MSLILTKQIRSRHQPFSFFRKIWIGEKSIAQSKMILHRNTNSLQTAIPFFKLPQKNWPPSRTQQQKQKTYNFVYTKLT